MYHPKLNIVDIMLDGYLTAAAASSHLVERAWDDPAVGKNSHVGWAYDHVSDLAVLSSVSIQLSKSGTPADTIKCGIWDINEASLNPGDALVVSNEAYGDGDLTTSGAYYSFTFTGFSPSVGSTYRFACYRTGASSTDRYKVHYSGSGNPVLPPFVWVVTNGSWALYNNQQIGAQMMFADVDISDRVESFSTNVGRNDPAGDYVEGSCSLTLANHDGALTPTNTASDYFSLWRLGRTLELTVDSNPIFKGYVTSIDPSLEDHSVDVDLEDMFYYIHDRVISLGAKTTPTVHDTIQDVLDELDVDYSLDAEGLVLASLTWNDENAFDKLNALVGVCLGAHFVGEDGVYYFRNNQWPAVGDSDYEYDFDDPTSGTDSLSISYSLDDIINRVRVWYTGDNWTAWASNGESVSKYGSKDEEYENELMPNLTYAEQYRDYLKDVWAEPAASIELQLTNLFPDVLDMTLGDKVTAYHGLSGLSHQFVVVNVQKEWDADEQAYHLTANCLRFYPIPVMDSWYDYESTPDKVRLWSTYDLFPKAQSFQVPSSGTLREVGLCLETKRVDHGGDGWINQDGYVEIYAADGSGHPTGAVLATSETVYLREGDYTFPFTGADKIALNSVNVYCAKLVITSQVRRCAFRGVMASSNTTAYDDSGWSDYSGVDAYLRVRVET